MCGAEAAGVRLLTLARLKMKERSARRVRELWQWGGHIELTERRGTRWESGLWRVRHVGF